MKLFFYLALFSVLTAFAYKATEKPVDTDILSLVYEHNTTLAQGNTNGNTTSDTKGQSEKDRIVADVRHEELKGPKYTIRVGYDGKRKPIPKITGKTVDERAKQWLNTVGLGHTLPTWGKLGETYSIDYTLPLCIAWADSHLGKANKSTNNIGNVGNNDRGDVIHFETLNKGIEAIFATIARGKYMKGHIILGTLSGEGRKRLGLPGCVEEKDSTKKCYATSMGVWSSNVRNCLSVLHNKDINEDWKFRLQ